MKILNFSIFHGIKNKKMPSYGTYKWKLSKKFQTVRIIGPVRIIVLSTGISKIWRHKKVKILIQKVFYPTVRINLKPKQYNKACQNFYDWARANTKYIVTILPFTKWSLKVFFQIAFKVVHSKYVDSISTKSHSFLKDFLLIKYQINKHKYF